MKTTLHILICLLPLLGYGNEISIEEQQEKEGYLVIINDSSTSDSAKIYAYQYLARWEYDHGNSEDAISMVYTSINIQKKNNDIEGLAISYSNLGFINNLIAKKSEAIKLYRKSLSYYKRADQLEKLANTINSIGDIYYNQEMYKEALKNYNEAKKLSQAINSKDNLSRTYSKIAKIYIANKEFNKALDLYHQSLVLQDTGSSKYGIAIIYSRIADCYILMKEPKKAMENYNTSLKFRKTSFTYGSMGNLYRDEGNFTKAIKAFETAIEMDIENKYVEGICYFTQELAETYYKFNQLQQANTTALDGYETAQKLGYPYLIKKYAHLLYQISTDQNNYKEALSYRNVEITMKDSLENEETKKASIRQQTQYDFEKEQILKANKEKEEARILTEATNRRNNIQYSLILLGILLLFGAVLSIGFIKVSTNVAEGLIFFAFLILFEFILVFAEPYMEQYTAGEPMYNLLANSLIALLIFPVHDILESKLKKRIVKN